MNFADKVEKALAFLQENIPTTPRTVVQLGTGLGSFAAQVENATVIPYQDIPCFPISTVTSHHGNLVSGTIDGHEIVVLQGRVHYYEGYSAKEVAFPIRVLSLLGAENLVVTNSAGGLNPLFRPGTIMILRDHLNFLGDNPLRGVNVDRWGPRFPDLSEPYFPTFIKTAFTCADLLGIKNVVSGTYACISGPSLETPAETRWLRESGADAVGMSSVPEVIVAIHAGMKVLGLSAVSNVNDPDNFHPILLEDILETTKETGPKLENLICEILNHI